MFGVVPKLVWSRYISANEDNLIPLALRSLVINTGSRRVLIDNGIGHKQGKKFRNQLQPFGGEGLIPGLARGGYRPEDITDVLLTHLHFDHCGGGIEKDAAGNFYPLFPQAKYWVSRKQWDNAMNPNIREADAYLPENLNPMKELGVLHLMDQENFLCEGIELRQVHGHTPGQLIPIIHIGEKRLVYGADLFPTKAHVPVKYNMAYDLDVTTTMVEKALFHQEFSRPGDAIFFEHDMHAECGNLTKTIKGYKIEKTFTVSDWLHEL